MGVQPVRVTGTLPADVSGLHKTIAQQLRNPAVSTLLLIIDSNGGFHTKSLTDLAEAIYGWRASKRIVAYADGEALSAALLLASACSEVSARPSARIGSLKVRAVLRDDPNQTIAHSGVYNQPMTGVQLRVDPKLAEQEALYAKIQHDWFISLIARYRGLSDGVVRERFGNGLVFSAAEALARGMIDRVETREGLRGRLVGLLRPTAV